MSSVVIADSDSDEDVLRHDSRLSSPEVEELNEPDESLDAIPRHPTEQCDMRESGNCRETDAKSHPNSVWEVPSSPMEQSASPATRKNAERGSKVLSVKVTRGLWRNLEQLGYRNEEENDEKKPIAARKRRRKEDSQPKDSPSPTRSTAQRVEGAIVSAAADALTASPTPKQNEVNIGAASPSRQSTQTEVGMLGQPTSQVGNASGGGDDAEQQVRKKSMSKKEHFKSLSDEETAIHLPKKAPKAKVKKSRQGEDGDEGSISNDPAHDEINHNTVVLPGQPAEEDDSDYAPEKEAIFLKRLNGRSRGDGPAAKKVERGKARTKTESACAADLTSTTAKTKSGRGRPKKTEIPGVAEHVSLSPPVEEKKGSGRVTTRGHRDSDGRSNKKKPDALSAASSGPSNQQAVHEDGSTSTSKKPSPTGQSKADGEVTNTKDTKTGAEKLDSASGERPVDGSTGRTAQIGLPRLGAVVKQTTYRVGLSKRMRIAPLLKTLRK